MTSRIKVVRVGTATLPLPAPLRLGPLEIRAREYAGVEVETNDGIVGKAYCLTRNAPVSACVERLITPVVVGRDADAESLWDDCSRATVAAGRTGLVVKALGLVDVALWDIAAQAAGVPLWRHLGATVPSTPVMMVAAYPLADRSPESLAEDVIRYGRAGYGRLKIARDPVPARMRRLLESAAAGLPDGTRLVVDGGYCWRSSTEALDETALWGDTPLAWLEDPLVPEDADGCAAIRRLGPYPVGVGDEVSHIATFRALLDAQALDVLRLDILSIGGVTPARRVLTLAAEHTMPVSFHVYPEVSIHLAAATPGSLIEMFDPDLPDGNPLDPVHRLLHGGPTLRAGTAVAQDAPGLGFDLDWSLFRG